MSNENKKDVICHICANDGLFLYPSFKKRKRTTSDCKPWPQNGSLALCERCSTVQKILDPIWHAEVKEIYANYELYHQTPNGNEQVIFNRNGHATPRSLAVLHFLQSLIRNERITNIIDVGCGTGTMLSSLAAVFPQAKLYGFEPNIQKKSAIEAIKNVVHIYTDSEDLKKDAFDLMIMNHVLEHIPQPLDNLKKLGQTITPQGYLMVVVPDYTENPFDLIIADHASHFSIESLHKLLLQSGFNVLTITNQIINKEIIALCKFTNTIKPNKEWNRELIKKPQARQTNLSLFLQKQLDWLDDLVAKAKTIAASHRPFGIFGTSIAANWLYGELEGHIDFFVDEDQNRVNQLYRQKPVYHPSHIPQNSHTFVGLQPQVTPQIIARIASSQHHVYASPDFNFE